MVVVLLAGCTAEDDSPDEAAGTPSSSTDQEGNVLQPGLPGEPNTTLGPDATLEPGGWTESDAEFLTMMIPHHAQALEMAELARTRAQDTEVRAIADRIGDAQGAEIVMMAGWLQEQGLDVPSAEDVADHLDMGGMTGMLTPDEMDELAAAEGERFDALFLRGMVRHHAGAIDMARAARLTGGDVRVGEIADDTIASQSAEIGRMRDLLRRLR